MSSYEPIQVDAYPIRRDPSVEDTLASLLPTALRGQPRWEALVASWGAEAQEVEDALFLLVVDTAITNAKGDALDRAGAIAFEQRLGLSDVDYRRIISTRIRVNRSPGDRQTVADLLTRATGAETVQVRDAYPAALVGTAVVGALFGDLVADRIGDLIDDGVCHGVNTDWIAVEQGGFRFGMTGAFGGSPLAQVLG